MGKNKILSGISWSFAEKLLTDLVSTIITIVLSRILMPEDYGLVALVTIFITISSIFVTTGLGTALVRDKDATEDQMSTIFYVNLIMGILIYIVLYLCAPLIARYRGNKDLVMLVRVLGLKIPISSIYNIQHAYVKKKMQFRLFFWSSFVGTIMSGVVGITMAYLGFGAWALVFSTLTDNVMDSIFLFFTTKWFPKPMLNIKECIHMIDFGVKILIKEFIGRVFNQIRGLIIGLKYSAADLAYNTKGEKFPAMFIEIVNTTVIRVMLPALSEIKDEKEKTKEVLKVSTQLIFFVITPMMFGLLATADNFLIILLTEKWLGAVPFLQLSCLAYSLQSLSLMNERILEANGLGNTLIKKRIFDISVALIGIAVALFFFDGAIYLCIIGVICTLISVVETIRLSSKITEYGILDHFKDNFGTLFVSAVMAIVVYFIGRLDYSVFLVFALQVLAGAAIYVLMSLLLRLEPAKYVIDFIKNK